MITLAFTRAGALVTIGGVTFANDPTAIDYAMDALKAGAPLLVGPIINGRDRPREDADLDALSELYIDGEDIETDYDLLDGTEPFDV